MKAEASWPNALTDTSTTWASLTDSSNSNEMVARPLASRSEDLMGERRFDLDLLCRGGPRPELAPQATTAPELTEGPIGNGQAHSREAREQAREDHGRGAF